MTHWWLLPCGFLFAAIGTLIGAGGGVIAVPVLLLTMPQLSANGVTETSLVMVAANAISGTISYSRMHRIDYRSGVQFALAALPGTIVGVWAVDHVGIHMFESLFGALLIVVGSTLGWRVLRGQWSDSGITRPPDWRGTLASVVIGFLSSFFGIGGGILHVPLLVAWLRYPVHIATATSHFILATTATVAVAIHIARSGTPPNLVDAGLLAAGAFPGATIGAALSRHSSPKLIVVLLAAGLSSLGVRLLIGDSW